MSPIQRGELENIVNTQISAIVVLSRQLKWIKLSLVETVIRVHALPRHAATAFRRVLPPPLRAVNGAAR